MTLEPNDLVEKLNEAEGEIGIVFGREDSGLSNEDVELCDFCVTIPTSKEYMSLNLSHAAAIILYEISKIKKGKKPRLASNSEKRLIFDNVEGIVNSIGYPAEKRKVFNTMIERILGRALVTGREANTLIGVLKKINKK
jgi:TrmH family RNA methyltransferase